MTLEEIASRDNLAAAFWQAARGKRHRFEVQRFAANLDEELNQLGQEVLSGSVAVGRFRAFEIHDPKRRQIHAPSFRERVLQHALMALIEPAIDRFLVDDTYACRRGKGPAAAVDRAQQHARRWRWHLKMDMKGYFASIDHEILRSQIRRRIRGKGVLQLIDRVLASFEVAPGRGLPIGALTSQHFANLYLAPLDRHLLEALQVGGMARYMDDVVVWAGCRTELRKILEEARRFAVEELGLQIKPSWQMQRTSRGLSFCGYRIFPRHLGLGKRRRRRYRVVRRHWEAAYVSGRIDSLQLQAGYASALAITRGADSEVWRRRELKSRPAPEA